jgi:hypothetical protein
MSEAVTELTRYPVAAQARGANPKPGRDLFTWTVSDQVIRENPASK